MNACVRVCVCVSTRICVCVCVCAVCIQSSLSKYVHLKNVQALRAHVSLALEVPLFLLSLCHMILLGCSTMGLCVSKG